MMQTIMKLMERMAAGDSTGGLGGLEGLFGSSKSTGSSSSSSSSSGGDFKQIIEAASQKYGVDSKLVEAVVKAESNFNPDAVSSAGAEGLMQLMPATASSLGVSDSLDPEQNVDGGVKLLRELLNRYDGDVSLTLAAYNAGPKAVSKYGGIPPYQETQTYVKRVLENYQS